MILLQTEKLALHNQIDGPRTLSHLLSPCSQSLQLDTHKLETLIIAQEWPIMHMQNKYVERTNFISFYGSRS